MEFPIILLFPINLQRTASSKMTGMGIPRLVVGKILNHVDRGVTAVYDRHGYDSEKKQALERWARRLQSILEQREDADVLTFVRA